MSKKLKDYHSLKKALPKCDIKFDNALHPDMGSFGKILKHYRGDLEKTFKAISRQIDLSKVTWITLEEMKITNLEILKTLPNLNRVSLFNVELESTKPLFELAKLEHFSGFFVRSPDGTTQDLIEGLRKKHPDIKVNSMLDVFFVAKELNLKHDKIDITFDDILAYHQKDVDPKNVTSMVLADGAMNGIRKASPHVLNYFDDLSGLKKYKNLEQININGSRFKDMTAFAGMKKLERVYINDSGLESLEGLQKVPNLKWLRIENTRVSDLSPLEPLKKLEVLEINKTPVASFEPLRKMPELFKIMATHTKVRDLSPLSDVKKLNTLALSFTEVKDLTPLENLTLRNLYMLKTRVKDIRPVILHGRNGPMFFDYTPFYEIAKKYRFRLAR